MLHRQWISGRCMVLPATARHRRLGLEIKPDLHSFSSRFHSMEYSMAYSMLRGIARLHLSVLYSRGAISRMCSIADRHITPFQGFLWYIPHDKWYIAPAIYRKGVIWQIRCYIAVTQDSSCTQWLGQELDLKFSDSRTRPVTAWISPSLPAG